MAVSNIVHRLLQFIIFSNFLFMAVYSATVEQLNVPSVGPETSVFNSYGEGPYTSVTDGRILKYNKVKKDFEFFAVSAPFRPSLCNGLNTTLFVSICGRPLGMGFYNVTNVLYVADTYFGLVSVGPSGGRGTILANSANGQKFRFLDGLNVDQTTGNVYFTDASSRGGINDLDILLATNDSTGRLLKYDPITKQVTTLLDGLGIPGGVGVSIDGAYLLVSEFIKGRIQKYYLKGPKANTAEIILNVTGNPDNIKLTSSGDFWVGLTKTRNSNFQGIKINGFGNILETLTFSPEFEADFITEVQEYGDALLLGSVMGKYLGLYRR